MNLRLPALALIVLVLCSAHTLMAQQFARFQVSGEVFAIDDSENRFNGDIAVGDLVTGSLVYSLDAEDLAPDNDNYGNYQLNDAVSRLSFMIGTHEFYSLSDEGNPNKVGFSANVYKSATSNADSSMMDFRSWHNVMPFSDVDNTFESSMNLNFTLAEGKEMESDALPATIDLDDWKEPVLLYINYWGGRQIGRYSIRVKITAITGEVVDGGTIKGSVYKDHDENCEMDGADFGLQRRVIKVTPGPYYAMTDADGNYELLAPVGDYEVHLVPRPHWEQVCPAGALEVSLENEGDVSEGNDFALKADAEVEALRLSVASGRARVGAELKYTICYHNVGTVPYTGTISFTHDDLLTDFASDPAADSYTAPTATWEFENLPVDATGCISITLKIPNDPDLNGEEICAEVSAETNSDDEDLLNDGTDEICQEIRNSWDPNDIRVFPAGIQPDGKIARNTKVLSYIIRFQNTGSAEAIDIRVVDKLSEHLNVDKLKLGAVSHDYTFKISGEGVLEWTFTDINLPYQSMDEAGSQGYIKYEVHLKEGLPLGTDITNRAEIYFDSNPAVITNTVHSLLSDLNTSVSPDAVAAKVLVYPNPARDRVQLKADEALSGTLEIRTLLGQVVYRGELENATLETLDLGTLAAGQYFVNIHTADGLLVKHISIVR